MPGTKLGDPQLIIEAKTQDDTYVALIANNTTPPNRVAPVDLVIAAASAVTGSPTAQAITIVSVATTLDILPGQFLSFEGDVGSYLVEITAIAAASGTLTEITGIAAENIPVGATAKFPARVELAGEISNTDTTSTSTISTFDHEGSGQSVRGDSEQSLSLTIPYSPYNAGIKTLIKAKRTEQDIYYESQVSNPDGSVYTNNGEVEWCVGKVTDVSRSGANGSELSHSVSISVDGGFKEVRPA